MSWMTLQSSRSSCRGLSRALFSLCAWPRLSGALDLRVVGRLRSMLLEKLDLRLSRGSRAALLRVLVEVRARHRLRSLPYESTPDLLALRATLHLSSFLHLDY